MDDRKNEKSNLTGFVDPDTAARWLKPQDPIEVPEDGWTVALVEDRLTAAIRYAQRTGGRVLPKAFGTAWPTITADIADQIADAEAPTRTILQLTSAQVTRAEASLEWPMRYVTDLNERKALALWMLGKAIRRPWQKLAAASGWARETAKRRKARAIYAIIVGLTSACEPPAGSGRF